MSPDERTEKTAAVFSEQTLYQCKQVADTYDEAFASLLLLQYDLKVLAEWFDKPGRLLDLGCGTGRAMLAFGRRGYDVTGVDLSPAMLVRAREKLDAAGLTNAKLVEGNLADLPMDKLAPPYDYACCNFATLDHVRGRENRARFLSRTRSLLAPGGQFVFHVQNLFYNLHTFHLPFILTGAGRWLIGRGELGDQIFWWYSGKMWVTLHAFRPREIEQAVADAGLELMEIRYLNKACSGPLEGERYCAWRSHGFIVRCRRPPG